MKAKEKVIPSFLTGGGEMGELIRAFDWSKTTIGSPDTWPQSLRIAARIMLDCPFGMYIAWGNDFIQMYNDGYRPILGTTKHPQALGTSTPKTFAEIWPTIGPMFEGVMQGIPVRITDFVVQLDRNGYLEECVFDFSYSPLRLENGEVGGVLTTVIETTEKVKALKALKESESRFQNLIREVNVGIVVLSGKEMRVEVVNKAYGQLIASKPNDLLGKPLFDLIPDAQDVFLPILNKVRLTGETVYLYEQPYGVEVHGKKIEGYLNVVYQAYKETDGTISGVIALCQDVTETIKSRKQMEESENQFRTFADSIQNLAWIANSEGLRYWYNQRWYDYTGSTIEEMEGLGWEKSHHPDHIKNVSKFLKEAWKKEEPFELTVALRRHDGAYRWFLTRAYPVKDASGNIERWIGTNTDITEQRSFTEELETKVKERTYQLHIQNETFKQAEESSMQGSYSFNLTTGQLAYSDNLFRLIGYEPNEFEPSLEEFNKHVHPDDKEYITQAVEKVLQTNVADEWHYRMKTKSGALIHIKGTGRIIVSDHQKLLVGTLQDVTKEAELNRELQEKEEYRKQVINNAPDAVIVINEKNEITLWNPKTEAIFGWKAEEVLGLQLTDIIIPTQYREAHREGMKRFLKTGEARILNKTLEVAALNKEGKAFPISLTISQTSQRGNKLFIAFIRDITLEKQNKEDLIFKSKQLEEMNQSLELKNKELESSNTELASFSYVASHDLQEPLRKIQIFGKRILEAENLSDTTSDYLNRMVAAGERMQNLIISLLDFSSSNSTKFNFETCDLNSIVEEAKSEGNENILEKHATIEYNELPIINGVRLQLLQVFTNLIANAIKYCQSDRKPHIKITASIIQGNEIRHLAANLQQEYHVIKIADNGIGFEMQYATKIFELFQRLHTKNDYSGTGIGLAIVKKIVTNHNGFIIAEGKLNTGSTFTIYLPTAE